MEKYTLPRMGCRACHQEMTLMTMSDGMFGFVLKYAFYCDNKECVRYGDLTVVGTAVEDDKGGKDDGPK